MPPFLDGQVRTRVRAEPHLSRAVRGRHGDKGHVDNEGEGRRHGGMVEVGVGVRGLRRGWAVGRGRQRRVARDEGEAREWAEGCAGDLRDDWVCFWSRMRLTRAKERGNEDTRCRGEAEKPETREGKRSARRERWWGRTD